MTTSFSAPQALRVGSRTLRLSLDLCLAYGFTLVRLPLSLAIVVGISNRSMVVFPAAFLGIVADNLDGRFGARVGRPLPLREALDGVIDRVCIYAILVAAAVVYNPDLLWLVAIVGARDLWTGIANARLAFTRRKVPKAGPWHALGSIGHVAFAVAIIVDSGQFFAFAIGLADVIIGLSLAISYHRNLTRKSAMQGRQSDFEVLHV